MAINPSSKLRALRVKYIEHPGYLILKRGRTTIKLGSDQVIRAVRLILQSTLREAATTEEICNIFSHRSRKAVRRLVEQLVDWNLLVPENSVTDNSKIQESSLDLFYWDFSLIGSKTQEFGRKQIAIVGVNSLSNHFARALRKVGIKRPLIKDHPLLRNRSLFPSNDTSVGKGWPDWLDDPEKWNAGSALRGIDCVVMTSDFGKSSIFSEVNNYCLNNKIHFFPLILHNYTGYIGPFIAPGETACYDCLRARWNSHLDDRSLWETCENAAFECQDTVGFHPSMPAILAHIAALELMKIYTGLIQGPKIGTLIELDLVDLRLTKKRILKVPRCHSCSPMNDHVSTNPDKTFFMPLDWTEHHRT
jgi:bacteriocin biosynthesis cyclodehydratase domain-containing protein